MLLQFYAVARNACLEAVRQTVHVVVLLAVIFLMSLGPYLSAYTFEDDNKMALDLGLSTMLVGATLLAAFNAAGVIGRSLEDRTVLTILSKPLPRPIFIIGSFVGVAAAVLSALWTWTMVLILTTRMGERMNSRSWDDPAALTFGLVAIFGGLLFAVGRNYLLQRHFGATVVQVLLISLTAAVLLALPLDNHWQPQVPWTNLQPLVYQSVLLLSAMVLVICSIAVALSVRFGMVVTLVVCLLMLFLGLVSDFLFGANQGEWWGLWLYAIVPNLQILWLADAITQNREVTLGYMAMTLGYAGLYIAAVLSIAVGLFQTRQVA